MPRTSKADAAASVLEAEIEGHYGEVGPYTVGFETFPQDIDPAPLFSALPDGRCQSPHWGVVLRGQLVFRYPDREETVRAGDAYYAAAGHLPLIFAGTEVVEFSPTEEFRATMDAVGAAMAAAGAGE
ncbi:MAG TPA: hypothetical protein VFU35_11725 [Jatrophihabitans sp.]|nr:hypothetical protein [Jatrophihabitans sp.]